MTNGPKRRPPVQWKDEMALLTQVTAPVTLRDFERSARFGPKGQPFFLARYSDGTTKMVPGLNPIERQEFRQQHLDAGTDPGRIEVLLSEINREEAPSP